MMKKLTVREAESLSRRVATDKIRNKGKYLDPAIIELEKSFTETLGTRVRIEKGKEGGTVTIDFFSPDDLRVLLEKMHTMQSASAAPVYKEAAPDSAEQPGSDKPIDDRAPADVAKEDNTDLYSLKNFSL
jgi:hypothetical protein